MSAGNADFAAITPSSPVAHGMTLRPAIGPVEIAPAATRGHAAPWRQWDRKIVAGLRLRTWCWLGPVLYATTLGGPFVLDDLYMIRRIERWKAGELAEPALFKFCETPEQMQAQRDRTTFAWWISRSQTTAFFRPVSELAFLIDHALFGRFAPGYRLVSLTWFMVLLFLLRRLFVLAAGDSAVADVATTFFGVAQTVALPATFISNRSDLLVAAGSSVAAWAFWRAMRSFKPARWPIGWLLLGALAYSFALGSKEAAAPLGAVWVVYALVEWRRRAKHTSLGAAMNHAAGTTGGCRAFGILGGVMAAGYLGFYVLSGHGVHDFVAGDGQVGVAGTSGRLVDIVLNSGLLLSVWLLGAPGGLALLFNMPALAWISGALALLPAVMFVRAARPHWNADAAFRFFAVWAVMFSLPALIATPEPRLLCTAGIGWAYCLARFVCIERERIRGVARRLLHEWLLCANVGMAAAFGLGASLSTQWLEQDCQNHVKRYLAKLPRPLAEGEALYVTQPVNRLELFAPGARLEFLTGCEDVRLHYLSVDAGLSATLVRRVIDDRTLLLSAPPPGLFGGVVAPRRDDAGRPLQVGSRFENRDFSVELTRMEGPRVLEARFRFRAPLQSPGQWFIPPLDESRQAPAAAAQLP